MTEGMNQTGRRSNYGLISLGFGVVVWLVQILTPAIGIGVLGAEFENMSSAGTNSMPEEQIGDFVLMIIMGGAGLAGIVGFIIGLMGLTTGTHGPGKAVIGIVMNASSWIWTALFFIFVGSYAH
ncbi:MAG: hypothetical protein P8J89_05645 [Phycisphaerales bacterium]|nr:hypothetical protein [Phycisphaerales bacterium]|tara:strand:- start:1280 stop:1651 length:372 start_codon:yes stop_codon:yes gene_type:complete